MQSENQDLSRPLTVIGLMSGTSVDAVDACCARLWQEADGAFRHEILATHTQEMPEDLRGRLLECMTEKHADLAELCLLNRDVGLLFAETTLALLRENGLDATEIDCIGSHGQTIFHIPPTQTGSMGTTLGTTLQIGEPSIIAAKTGIETIADFRPYDMAVGGHGAPLVCFADQLLFQLADTGRCVQNIGGIANVTALPAKNSGKPLMAFDTGPGNMMIDAAMEKYFGQSYDENGAVAARGNVDAALLAHLLDNPYFLMQPPKTTGRELFGADYFQRIASDFPHVSPDDMVTTLTRFTAETIAHAYENFVLPAMDIREMIVGGGGVYNRTLLQTTGECFAARGIEIAIRTHADVGVPDKYKEALAFAMLAWAAYHGLPNNVPSCTGASRAVVMGKRVTA